MHAKLAALLEWFKAGTLCNTAIELSKIYSNRAVSKAVIKDLCDCSIRCILTFLMFAFSNSRKISLYSNQAILQKVYRKYMVVIVGKNVVRFYVYDLWQIKEVLNTQALTFYAVLTKILSQKMFL